MSSLQSKSFSFSVFDPNSIEFQYIKAAINQDGTLAQKAAFNTLNSTMDSAPMLLQKMYLKNEGKGGVLEERDYTKPWVKGQPSATKPLAIPQLKRHGAQFSALLSPSFPKGLLESDPDVCKNLRSKQYMALSKTYKASIVVWNFIFDGNLAPFQAEKAACVKKATAKLNPGNAPVDAELQAKIDELARAEFLKIRNKSIVNPDIYTNWDNTEDVVLKTAHEYDTKPGSTKCYPKRFMVFLELYVWGAIFKEVDGKYKMAEQKKTTPDYDVLPYSTANYAEILHRMALDGKKMNHIKWFDDKVVAIERPNVTFPATANAPSITAPDPAWMPIDLSKEEFMVTVRSTLKVTKRKPYSTEFIGVEEHYSPNIVISYRAPRPDLETREDSESVAMASNADCFAGVTAAVIASKKRAADAMDAPPAPSASNADLFKLPRTV